MKSEKQRTMFTRWLQGRPLSLAINSQQLAVGCDDGEARIYDFERNYDFGERITDGAKQMAVAYDPDGRLHAGLLEQREGRLQVALYRPADRGPPLRAEGGETRVNFLMMSPLASVMAFANHRGECLLWDGSGKAGGTYVPAGWPGGSALSFDGERIATCEDSGESLFAAR